MFIFQYHLLSRKSIKHNSSSIARYQDINRKIHCNRLSCSIELNLVALRYQIYHIVYTEGSFFYIIASLHSER